MATPKTHHNHTKIIVYVFLNICYIPFKKCFDLMNHNAWECKYRECLGRKSCLRKTATRDAVGLLTLMSWHDIEADPTWGQFWPDMQTSLTRYGIYIYGNNSNLTCKQVWPDMQTILTLLGDNSDLTWGQFGADLGTILTWHRDNSELTWGQFGPELGTIRTCHEDNYHMILGIIMT